MKFSKITKSDFPAVSTLLTTLKWVLVLNSVRKLALTQFNKPKITSFKFRKDKPTMVKYTVKKKLTIQEKIEIWFGKSSRASGVYGIGFTFIPSEIVK